MAQRVCGGAGTLVGGLPQQGDAELGGAAHAQLLVDYKRLQVA